MQSELTFVSVIVLIGCFCAFSQAQEPTPVGDLDGNGFVDGNDAFLLFSNWHQGEIMPTPTPTATVSPTPTATEGITPTPTLNEQQVQQLVTQVSEDILSVAEFLEGLFVSEGEYPDELPPQQLPDDPFNDQGPMIYLENAGTVYFLSSYGPDRDLDVQPALFSRGIGGFDTAEEFYGSVESDLYDPTNGTVSNGDIVRVHFAVEP